MVDETLLQRITANPEIFGGKPIIRELRISAELILRPPGSGGHTRNDPR